MYIQHINGIGKVQIVNVVSELWSNSWGAVFKETCQKRSAQLIARQNIPTFFRQDQGRCGSDFTYIASMSIESSGVGSIVSNDIYFSYDF